VLAADTVSLSFDITLTNAITFGVGGFRVCINDYIHAFIVHLNLTGGSFVCLFQTVKRSVLLQLSSCLFCAGICGHYLKIYSFFPLLTIPA